MPSAGCRMETKDSRPRLPRRKPSQTMCHSMKRSIFTSTALVWLSCTIVALAGGIPEPGLVMYGAVRNSASSNGRLVSGTITWTIVPASGTPITVTAKLTNLGNQYSYLLPLPFETVVGNFTLSTNVLQLNSTATSYARTNVTLTIGSNTFPASIVAPSTTTFTFGP